MTPVDDDTALHGGAVTGAIADRRQIAVAGADRASFLQGFLTNDIPALAAGQGCYAAWLTPQGRMLTDLHVLESRTSKNRPQLGIVTFGATIRNASGQKLLDAKWPALFQRRDTSAAT